MANLHSVNGYDEFCSLITKLLEEKEKDDGIYVYFTGSKDSEGKSWCPDCVAAEPFINSSLQYLTNENNFITVCVGDRTFWKNPECPFRTDDRLKLTYIPTLMAWGKMERLEQVECKNPELIKLIFTGE